MEPAGLEDMVEALLGLVREEARILFREALDAEWWREPTYKDIFRSRGEALEGPLKKWLKKRVQELGLRKYKVVSHGNDSGAVAAVFSRGRGGYRLTYAILGNLVTVRVGRTKYVLPATAAVYHGVLARKYATPIDLVLPRYRRRLVSAGYWLEMEKAGPGHFTRGDPGDWHLVGSARITRVIPKAPPRKIRVEGLDLLLLESAGEETIARYDFAARCRSAATTFVDHKARYALYIPPVFIVWKWAHVIYPDAIVNRKPAREVCPLGG